jgi:hypothetical protein
MLTPSFWNLHIDHAMAMDTGAATLITIQMNLVAGTLAKYIKTNPFLENLMGDILAFRVVWVSCFCVPPLKC